MYDVIIIGSGPAGLTAAIYTTRGSLKTIVIAGAKWGGQLQLTTDVENFPGFPKGIQGPDLMCNMREQAEKFGAEFIDDDFPDMDFSSAKSPFTIKIGEREIQGKAVLIATGADAKTLGVPGEKELTGRGISYCATCDAAFFRNKNVIVVGGGDSAMEEANFLTHFASHVTVVHRRDEFRASQIMQDRCKSNPKISFMLNSQIVEVMGEHKLERVKIKTLLQNTQNTQQVRTSDAQKVRQSDVLEVRNSDTPSIPEAKIIQQNANEVIWEMPIDGIFVAIGHTPNTRVFQGIEVNEKGYVLQEGGTRTNIEGVFVAGDVQDDRYQQAITAAGFGCMAALDIERWIRDLE